MTSVFSHSEFLGDNLNRNFSKDTMGISYQDPASAGKIQTTLSVDQYLQEIESLKKYMR